MCKLLWIINIFQIYTKLFSFKSGFLVKSHFLAKWMLKRICQDVNRFQDQCRCYIMCSNALKTNYLSIIILISLIILNIASVCSADDSPFELYPFNKSNGDTNTPLIDDGGSNKIKLKRTFKFFGKNYTSVYVSKDIIFLFLIS